MACPRAETGCGEAVPKLRVVDALRAGLDPWLAEHQPTPEQARLIRDLRRCRTAALGGHLHVCQQCAHEVPVYNSCRNRHCPNCQALDQARWIEAREAVLLPVGHHHVVFTLPSQLRSLALHRPRELYGLLFDAVSATLTELAEQLLGVRLGVTAVLHTWRRDLGHHPHVHCIVTAGGLTLEGSRWVERLRFLLPARRMKAAFRSQVIARLERLQQRGALDLSETDWSALHRSLPAHRQWVVYIEPPFGRSTHVLQYLGRYTHRIAISDARLVALDDRTVSFVTRDSKVAVLPLHHFVGRFLLHVLPAGFRKIRHYGLYAPGAAAQRRDQARQLLGRGDLDELRPLPDPGAEPEPEPGESWDVLTERLTGKDPLQCPSCGARAVLRYVLSPVRHAIEPRGPP